MISTIDRISSSINQHQQPTSIINRMASSTDWHHQLTSFPIWQGSSTNWPHQPTSIINRPVSITIPISTIWLAEIVEVKQQYINVGVQLHLKVIDDSLHKQGKANQDKGIFCIGIINWPASSTDWYQPWPPISLSPLVGWSCSCLEKEHWAVGKCCTSSCAMKGTSLVRELVQKRPLPWFALPCLGNESSITFKCNCTPTLIYCCLPLTISANHSVEIGIVIETL